jgi:hypothetical protein
MGCLFMNKKLQIDISPKEKIIKKYEVVSFFNENGKSIEELTLEIFKQIILNKCLN